MVVHISHNLDTLKAIFLGASALRRKLLLFLLLNLPVAIMFRLADYDPRLVGVNDIFWREDWWWRDRFPGKDWNRMIIKLTSSWRRNVFMRVNIFFLFYLSPLPGHTGLLVQTYKFQILIGQKHEARELEKQNKDMSVSRPISTHALLYSVLNDSLI